MHDDRLKQWLEAERAGRSGDAEALFSGLFAEHVPVFEPPRSLTGPVLEAVLSARAERFWAWRSVRALGSASLVLMGLVMLTALSLDPFAVLGGVASVAAALITDATALVRTAFAAGLTAWALAAALGRAAATASSSGIVPFVLAANLLLALASSYALRRVMAPREECSSCIHPS